MQFFAFKIQHDFFKKKITIVVKLIELFHIAAMYSICVCQLKKKKVAGTL